MRPLIVLVYLLWCAQAYAQPAENMPLDIRTASPDTNKVLLYGSLSTKVQYTNADSAIWYAQQGLELARELDYASGEGKMLHQLGMINEIHGDMDAAKEYLQEALKVFEKTGHTEGIAASYNRLGVSEGKTGNLDKATRYFFKALKLYESIGNNKGIVQTYIKLGTVNEISGEPAKALEYYNKALEINTKHPEPNVDANLLNNMGIVYAKQGDMQKALQYFEDGLAAMDEPLAHNLYVNLLANAGNANAPTNAAKALEYYNKALTATRANQFPEEEARTLINIASAVAASGDGNGAHKYLDSALTIANRIEHLQMRAEIWEARADLYEQQGNYKAAMAALRKHHVVHDSLINVEKAETIAGLQNGYELQQSKMQVRELELANQERTFERNLGIVIGSGILCILLILGYYLRKTAQLNKQLKESNLIKDKLFSIIGHDLRGPIGRITQILGMLESEDFPEETRRELITELRKQGELSLDILNAMLTWGKTQLQGMKVNMVDFAPKTVVQKNVEVLSNQAKDKGITIKDNIAKSLTAHADPDHFDFVIRNLLSNAIKFTYPGGNIVIDAKPDMTDGVIIFSVQDDGIGISAEKQQEFLNANLQVTYGTSGEKGTGFGLLLSKEFIKANDGKMWLTSIEGQGSIFYFSLKMG